MSALDDKGVLKNGCPECKADLKWWYFSSDCRGNPSISGCECKKCNYKSDELPMGLWELQKIGSYRYSKNEFMGTAKAGANEKLKGFEKAAKRVLREKDMSSGFSEMAKLCCKLQKMCKRFNVPVKIGGDFIEFIAASESDVDDIIAYMNGTGYEKFGNLMFDVHGVSVTFKRMK